MNNLEQWRTTMTKQFEDDERRRKVARDGERVTVPLLMMDAETTARIDRIIKDAQKPTQMHRPGFVQLSDVDRSKRERIYREHEKNVTDRWKNPMQRANHNDASPLTGEAKSSAHVHYEQRLTNAWRPR